MNVRERGWILYDGACGFCSRWVPAWGPWLRHLGYGWKPLQDPWVAERTGLSPEDLLEDLRLLLPDGTLRVGPEVYREVLAASPWTRPLHGLSRMPGLRQAFDGGYRLFARHRYRISAACGWRPPE